MYLLDMIVFVAYQSLLGKTHKLPQLKKTAMADQLFTLILQH